MKKQFSPTEITEYTEKTVALTLCSLWLGIIEMNLKTAVEGFVGANLFARSTSYVRINSHLHSRRKALDFQCIHLQLRFPE